MNDRNTKRVISEQGKEMPKGLERGTPGVQHLEKARIIAQVSTSGPHTIRLYSSAGLLTGAEFYSVPSYPTSATFSVGDDVMVLFKTEKEISIVATSGSGGSGGTTTVITGHITFFASS